MCDTEAGVDRHVAVDDTEIENPDRGQNTDVCRDRQMHRAII